MPNSLILLEIRTCLKVTGSGKSEDHEVLTNLSLLPECVNAGLGYCLTFLPTVTILSQYFSRRRSLVTSMASTGESFAIFAFAPGENNHAHIYHLWHVTLSKCTCDMTAI